MRDNNFGKLNITITGMTCTTCARTVEKAIKKIPGVKYAAVNLATNQAFIILEKPLDLEEIKKAVEEVGYGVSMSSPEDVERKRYKKTLRNLILALIPTVPLTLMMFLHMAGIHIPSFHYLEFILTFLVIFVAGIDVLKGAWIAVSHYHANMDTLISIGALTCFLTSAFRIVGFEIESFGTIGAMIISIHILGRFIESSLRDKAFREIKSLINLKPKEARVILDGEEVLIPADHLREGMLVIVRPGERIPADGVIEEGRTSVDESMISGEAIPVEKEKGSKVLGGTLNLTGLIKIKVEKRPDESYISEIVKILTEVQGSRVPIQKIADRVTNYFVPTIVFLALLSFIFWYFSFDNLMPILANFWGKLPWVKISVNRLSFSIFVFVSVIVIACPCSLGLAIPMALVRGTVLASKKGVLIRNAEIIQTFLDVRYALFDKTGTLTEGKPEVVFQNLPEEDLKKVTYFERFSNHPLAGAISKLALEEVTYEGYEIEEVHGVGIIARSQSDEYFIGKPDNVNDYLDYLEKGGTVVEVRKNGIKIGFFVLKDKIREESFAAVKKLKEIGIKPVLLTGDNEKSAKYVAERLGIDEIYYEVKPEDKVNILREFQSSGGKVLMVGDGINDAPALKAADIAVTVSHGSDLAIENSDAVILKGGLSVIVDLLRLSGQILKKIKENLIWAFLYNGIAIPFAMMGLLHPIIAEGAMALSSISVILNSLRLK
ncbi:MAG: cation-translocating P-type ATPase [bacterium]|nr:cation-translocating P-type ATPase [bacterium]